MSRAWSSIRCATECTALCTAPVQKSSRCLGVPLFTASNTAFIRSSMPSFLLADMGSMCTPSSFSRPGMSMDVPEACTSSIMLSAITMGRPSSISCSVRYRLRSRLVASTMFIIAAGCCSSTKSRATISSAV